MHRENRHFHYFNSRFEAESETLVAMLCAVTSVGLVAVSVQTFQISKQVQEATLAYSLRQVALLAALLVLANGSAAIQELLEFDSTYISTVLLFATAVIFVVVLGRATLPEQNEKIASSLPPSFTCPVDVESPASPTSRLESVHVSVSEETSPTVPPPPSFVLLDSQTHLQRLRRSRYRRSQLSSINEDFCADTPKWMAYLGAHMAKELLPRVPAGGKEHTWDTVCDTVTSLADWLRSDDAEHLSKAFRPCFGFSCDRCSNAVQPGEETCPVCSLEME